MGVAIRSAITALVPLVLGGAAAYACVRLARPDAGWNLLVPDPARLRFDRAVVWLLLTSLFGIPFGLVVMSASSLGVLVSSAQRSGPAGEASGQFFSDAISFPVLAFTAVLTVLWLALWLAMTVAAARWLAHRWRSIEAATGLPAAAWLRWLWAGVAASLLLWPAASVGLLPQVAWMRSAWPEAAAARAAATIAALGIQMAYLAALVAACYVSYDVIDRIARGRRAAGWLQRRRFRIAAWLALVGVLTSGVAALAVLAGSLLVQATQLSAGSSGDSLSEPPGQQGSIAGLALAALPLLAYPLASRALARIDWSAVEKRIGWSPGRGQELLLLLAVASYLSWPFALPGELGARLGIDPARTLAVTAVVLAVAGLTLYRPRMSRDDEDADPT